MQRSASILLGIFLSALIIYGGSGVNAYFYCCGDCRVAGPSAVVEHGCCEIHQHDGCAISHEEGHECDQMISELGGECSVDRIQFDWQSSQENQLQLQPTVINLNNNIFSYNGYTMGIEEQLSSSTWCYRQSQKPPDLSKEDYFSLLNILII